MLLSEWMQCLGQRHVYSAIILLVLLISSVPALASHELEATQVSNQYILSLNLVALGNALPNWDETPQEIQDHFPNLHAAFSSEILRLTRSQGRDQVPDDVLTLLWQTPGWRKRFVELARAGWDTVLHQPPVQNFIDDDVADSELPKRSGTSILIELDRNQVDSLREDPSSQTGFRIATTAGAEETAFFVLQPNYLLSGAGSSNDPLLHAQWAFHHTEVPRAWDRTRGSSEVIVAVIDSGYDLGQVELFPNLWRGNAPQSGPGLGFCEEIVKLYPALVCDPTDLTDYTGHGTAMAGIIGARTNDRLRVAGVNWHVSLMILKVLGGANNRGSVFDAAKAIRFAAEHGAAIISLSLGGRPEEGEPRQALLNAIIESSGLGHKALVVVAAGNENLDLDEPGNLFFPASFKVTHKCEPNGWCFDNLVVVGATDPDDEKAAFSNHGTEVVDLGAPGVAILTTGLEKNWGVAEVTGTSAATALVASAAALVDAARPQPCDPKNELCYVLLKERLLEGAKPVSGLSAIFEHGRRLNACRSVQGVEPPGPGTCK